jgi:hypothetical protein
VQQRRDRFRFIRAVFHRDRSDPKDMPDIGNPGLFPKFAPVNSGGVYQCLFELTGELHICLSLCGQLRDQL